MTGTTHNTCALARARFTHDRSVCPVVTLYGVDYEDPDAQWPPQCMPVDTSGLGLMRRADPDYDARAQRVLRGYSRLEAFCNRNRCRVSP
jgi:hypothetical protein